MNLTEKGPTGDANRIFSVKCLAESKLFVCCCNVFTGIRDVLRLCCLLCLRLQACMYLAFFFFLSRVNERTLVCFL